MGFLDAGCDQNGLLSTAEKALDYFATIGQMPFLDHWLAKNPFYPIGPPTFDRAAGFCAQQSIARQQDRSREGSAKNNHEQKDMLDDFLDIKEEYPEMMTDNGVVAALVINIIAGSDTTAILLRAIIYYVLKNPRVYRKLQKELNSAKLRVPVSYTTANSLPYLDAVVREACRIHPGIRLLLERVVPEPGLTLSDGRFLPPATILGINPWVVHQNKTVFGEDALCFNPDWWLRKDEEGETHEENRFDLWGWEENLSWEGRCSFGDL